MPEPLEPPVEVEPLGRRADEQQPRARPPLPQERERLEQLRDPLVHVQVAEAADERIAANVRRLDGRLAATPGCGMRQSRPAVPGLRARAAST